MMNSRGTATDPTENRDRNNQLLESLVLTFPKARDQISKRTRKVSG